MLRPLSSLQNCQKHTYIRPGATDVTSLSLLYYICNFDFVVAIVNVQMCLAFKKGLSRSLQERSLDIGRALKSETLVQSSLEDCRANVEQFDRQWFERSIKTARHRGKTRICGRQIMRDNVQDYFRKSITTFSQLYAKWNENKVYQPSHQNCFGATVGSIYYWKYCPITEPPPHQKSLWIRPWEKLGI